MKRLVAILPAALLLCAQAPQQQIPQQPIPFSHRAHIAVGVKCLDCHAIRKPGFAAGLPKEETCMACHSTLKTDSPAVQKLADYFKTKKPVPWVRVYRVPDYVWFSHESHHNGAKIACEACHGPVAERDVLAREKPTSMASCMECHTARKAPNECNFCHETR